MTTRLLFFGVLKEIAGGERLVELPAHVGNFSSLIEWLSKEDAELGEALGAPSTRLAVDRRIVSRDESFSDPEEIAFMPPFSGG